MNRIFRTILVPLEHAQLGSALAATFGPGALAFGWTARCGAGGVPTHYITSGMLAEPFGDSLSSPQHLVEALAPVVVLSEQEAAEILQSLDVSDQDAEMVLQRLGFSLTILEHP